MSELCKLSPSQADWTERFKRYLIHEGVIQAGDAEYVVKIDVGKSHASLFVSRDVPSERLGRIFMYFVVFLDSAVKSVKNYHVSFCD